jgi:hypothetical protein
MLETIYWSGLDISGVRLKNIFTWLPVDEQKYRSTRPFSSRQIIPLISKLLIYVSVADDYATLEVGEFLNDIIIDFYLRQGS